MSARAASATAPPPPGVAEVRRIAAIGSPALRNLEITHCYARLAAAVAARGVGGANWCVYATWASRQAGRTIRGEDGIAFAWSLLGAGAWWRHPVAVAWRRLLRRGLLDPATRLGRLTAELHTPFDALERASAAVARGNLAVFAEIGEQFARHLEEVPAGAAPAGPEMARFLDGLRPGDPPEGQRLLRQAFTRYQGAVAGGGPAASPAQAVLLANLESSGCTSRPACSRRSARRSTPRRRRRRTSAGGCSTPSCRGAAADAAPCRTGPRRSCSGRSARGCRTPGRRSRARSSPPR